MRFSTIKKFSVLLLSLFFFAASSRGLSMKELNEIPDLTPEKFARYFADFEYQFHAEVQDEADFLSSQSGDCDDYATVAAEILKKNGYTTQLIAVRMKGETHVVCYINETKSYLDYNARKEANPTVSCENSITEIAIRVARSFDRAWIATYEFTYNPIERVKRLVQRIITNHSAENAS